MCPVWPSGAVSLITWAGCSGCVPCVGCVCLSVVVDSWLLAYQWVGPILRLIGVRTIYDYSGGAIVQQLTLQNKIYFNRALLPSQSSLWVCYSRLWPCVVFRLSPKPAVGGAAWEWPHCRSSLAAACALPGATWYEPPSKTPMHTGLVYALEAKPQTEAGCC